MLELHVIRHGETQANAEGRYLGALDLPLGAEGLRQAGELAACLPAEVDAIVVSPLLRARQTAEAILANRALPLFTLAAFRERDVGVFEGLTRDEARARHASLWERNVTRRWAEAPPGGETIAQVVERVQGGLEELSSRFAGRSVVLVAHGFVGKCIRALVREDFSDFFEWQLPNAGILQLTLERVPTCPERDPLTV